jgi:hypothetical protein
VYKKHLGKYFNAAEINEIEIAAYQLFRGLGDYGPRSVASNALLHAWADISDELLIMSRRGVGNVKAILEKVAKDMGL